MNINISVVNDDNKFKQVLIKCTIIDPIIGEIQMSNDSTEAHVNSNSLQIQ